MVITKLLVRVNELETEAEKSAIGLVTNDILIINIDDNTPRSLTLSPLNYF